MSAEDYIYYFNNIVMPDILALVQAKWPGELQKSTQAIFAIPEYTISAAAVDIKGTAFSVVGHTAQVGDVVQVTGTTSYDGFYLVLDTATDQISVGKVFVADETGTLSTPKRVELPTDFYSIRDIYDTEYGRQDLCETSIFSRNVTEYTLKGQTLIFPEQSMATNVQIDYMAQPSLIVATTDSCPFSAEHHQELLPIINNGIALSYFRDRKKTEDIKIYFDLYEQAKQNIAVLSVHSL